MRLKVGDLVTQKHWHHALPECNLGLGKVVEAVPQAQVRVRWQGGRLLYENIASLKKISPLVALAMMADA